MDKPPIRTYGRFMTTQSVLAELVAREHDRMLRVIEAACSHFKIHPAKGAPALSATTTQRARIVWSGKHNNAATFNGHELEVRVSRAGVITGRINGTSTGRTYTTEDNARKALRRRAAALPERFGWGNGF